MPLQARYFDGQSSRAHAVTLSLFGDRLSMQGPAVQRQVRLSELRIGERLGRAARRLEFADGAHLEVTDHERLDALLAAAGHRGTAVEKAQRSLLPIAFSLIAVLLLALAGYRYLLPRFVDSFAEQLPASLLATLSDQVLQVLDDNTLHASKLPAERQQAIRKQFAGLRQPDAVKIEVLFRSSERLGPNALALPDGRILLLDKLVDLASQDDQILAVLAHETTHVRERHGVRALLRSTVVATAAAWWLGDISNLLALAPTVLLNSRYSRELEADADAGAARLLKANGRSPALLAEMLRKLEAADRAPPTSASNKKDGWMNYLDSHPASEERIRRLETGR